MRHALRRGAILAGLTSAVSLIRGAAAERQAYPQLYDALMVLIEAMTLGTPVVAYDCPTGPAELVDDGVTGLLVEAQNVPALAAAINRAIEEPELREAMGRAGQQRVHDLNPEAVADHWERLLEELVAGHGSPAVGNRG